MSCNTVVSLEACVFVPLENTHGDLLHNSFSQQGYSESPDLEFEYADTDKWAAELSGKAEAVYYLVFNKIESECHFGIHFISWLILVMICLYKIYY